MTNNPTVYGLSITEFIAAALLEDIGDGDHTSLACIGEHTKGEALVKVKEEGVIAGLTVACDVLRQVDPALAANVLVHDGSRVKNGEHVIKIEGNIQSILKAERLLLNILQRMSGIATLTRKMTEKISPYKAKISDTRKTTPNFRRFEKLAVLLGGGCNHRMGLYDMILIKDNHIDASGGITHAIAKAKEYLLKKNIQLAIEIETRNLNEVSEVLSCGGIQRIMLDNFSTDQLKEAVLLINRQFETEASGNITLENINSYAACGVDFISSGSLTHSSKSLDISLKIIK